MESNKSQNEVLGSFDLCFHDFNLSGALFALAALHSGLKVAIQLERPLRWEFEPEMITIYPIKLKQLFDSSRQIRFFEKISSLFPSMVYPQRVLTVLDERKFRSKTVFLIDFFLNRDREVASLPITFSRYPSFQALENHFYNGLLVQELRFDRNMAIIKMLQRCRQLGASIFNERTLFHQQVNGRIVFNCLPSQYHQKELKMGNFQLKFKNNIRAVTRDFDFTTQIRESESFFHFHIKRSISQPLFLEKVHSLLSSIGIDSPEKFRKELISIFKNLEQENFQQGKMNHLSDPEISEFKKYCQNRAKKISKATGKNIRFKKTIKTLKCNKFDGFGFRKLQAECDEKFDLAKQTGIEYPEFCYYFFRYYNDMDDFIELAYQQMSESRADPHLAWKKVESDFQKKIENEIFLS